MRLAGFLEVARDQILEAAVSYARTIPALSQTPAEILRDHLPEMLETISADLRMPQSRTESISKSIGDGPPRSARSSAQTHGLLRAQRGITLEELVAEFRALRSSILRLWADAHPPGPNVIDDIMRFNEAIDQAVAESVQFYAEERERWRQLFLGVLGHDLRGPLNAIAITVEIMRLESIAPQAQTALLGRGVRRLTSLLDSLLEYNRASLGAGMALQAAQVNLAEACAEELELLRVAFPGADIAFDANGNAEGRFDSSRVREALGNLVSNAVGHGEPTRPIVVRVEEHGAVVRISVENAGAIPAEDFELLFEPLHQRKTTSATAERSHLGLGLFVVRQIARAHGGEIIGSCSNGQVKFTIELPKATSVGPTT